jgi:hypothetical protein
MLQKHPAAFHCVYYTAPYRKFTRVVGVQAASDAVSTTTSLLDWIASRGVDVSRLAVAVGDEGLVAARPVAKGETLCSIPESAWITKSTAALNSTIGQYLDGLEAWVAVALFLMAERSDPSSPWQPYLSSLPAEIGSPLAWTEDDLQLLSGTQLLAAVESYQAFFRQRYDQLQTELFSKHRDVFSPEIFSYDAFLWAACTVRARSHAPLDGEEMALVPFADLVSDRNPGCNLC